MVSELWGLNFRGICIATNFHRPLAAKLCVGGEYILEVRKWYRPLYHHAKFGGVQIFHATGGPESSMFFFGFFFCFYP